MEKVKAFVLMIRPVNLAMIALIQLLIRFFIILPVFGIFKIQSTLNHFEFGLMIVATLLIAASGYIINDYFDVSIDAVNKPFRLTVNKLIPRYFAINLHLSFNIIAVVLAFAVSYIAGNYKLSFIYIVAAGLLWFYSSTYKKMFLLGNLVISLLTALVVLLPVLFELPVLTQTDYSGKISAVQLHAARIIVYTTVGYSIFAFLTTFIREIVKDMEDIKGDTGGGAHTVPIIVGLNASKWIVTFIWLLLIAFTTWICYTYYQSAQISHAWYFMLTVIIPSIAGIYMLFHNNEPQHFGRVSLLLKIIMLFGILSIPVLYYLQVYK
jgi:4-hydroxybenzoate polyprenyltransferase